MGGELMQLLYDHQIFTWQDYGGISRYFCELMSRFTSDPGIGFRLALRYSQNEHLQQHPELNRVWTNRNVFFSDSRFFSGLQKKMHVNVLNHLFNNQRESVKLLKSQDFDLFHPTYYDLYFLRHLENKPYVLTVYDMIHEVFPDHFGRKDSIQSRKKMLADNAEQIIAISENTKKDIIHYLDIPEDRIQVIYLADSLSGRINADHPTVPCTMNVPEKYLLFVGNRSGYKNFSFLLEALAPVFKKNGKVHLICAGGGAFLKSEREMMRTMNLSTRVHPYPADDETLWFLYKHAYAFVFPSLYEGFGIPVLEAFSSGCPALLSDTSSLPEVGGDAAVYFDPADRDSLTDAIDRILSDEIFRDEMVLKGEKRSKLFSWEKTAEMTKTVYETATE
jgi:glycosyltransferase involved in cell wall biosynthesis